MKTKHEFELGDKVIYTHILKRVHNRWGGHWEEVELPEPQNGVIVGARSKENTLEHGKFERFKVFMVGQQLFKGAKPVLPIHIKVYVPKPCVLYCIGEYCPVRDEILADTGEEIDND